MECSPPQGMGLGVAKLGPCEPIEHGQERRKGKGVNGQL